MSKLFIDIGGTKLRCEQDGKIQEYFTKEKELTAFLEMKLQNDKTVNAISVSFAGQVDKGVILSSPNINVKVKNIKEYFEKKYHISFKIDNDLNCALLAETKYIDEENIALLFIGSGVGGAVLESNRIIKGEKNIACEIGHIPFKKAPFLCGCGKDNCIEIYGGGAGLAKWFEYYGYEFVKLQELKEAKDKNLQKIYDNFLEAILRAAASLVTLFNPKVLILGGGIIKSNPFLLDIIKKDLDKFALKQSCEGLKIIASRLKNASLEGAKLL